MAGMFDDLIPAPAAKPAAPAPGMFDDLIPSAPSAPAALVKPGDPNFDPNWNAGQPYTTPMYVPGGSGKPSAKPSPGGPAAPAPVQSPDPNAVPGLGNSAARGVAEGATFNFAPEVHGLVMAGGDNGQPGSPLKGAFRLAGESLLPSVFGSQDSETSATDAYNRGRADERSAQEAAQKAHPLAYGAGELGGGLGSMLVAPELAPFKAAEGAGLVSRGAAWTGNQAVPGAVYGAISGAGANPDSRIGGATTGAATGAFLAPVIGAGVQGLVGAGRSLANNYRAVANPQSLADSLLARNIARDNPGANVVDVTNQAADALDTAANSGQPLTLADTQGANTRGAVGTITRYGGEAKNSAQQLLDQRQFGSPDVASQNDRVTSALTRFAGNGDGTLATADRIIAEQKAKADPLYQAARRAVIPEGGPIPVQWTPPSEPIPAGPAVAGPSAAGRMNPRSQAKAESPAPAHWQDEGYTGVNPNDVVHHIPEDKIPRDLVPRLKAAGAYDKAIKKMKVDGEPFDLSNVSSWDYMKRALDDKIGKAVRQGANDDVRIYTGLKKQLTSAIDDAVPVYGRARAVFAGDQELRNALENGGDAFRPSTTPEALRMQVDAMSEGERRMYRLGAINSLKDKLGNLPDGTDRFRAALGSPNLRAKMRAIAPDDASMAELEQFMNREKDMTITRNTTRGSNTANKLAEDADFGEGVENIKAGAKIAGSLVAGHPMGAVKELLGNVTRHLSKLADPTKREAVLEALREVALNPNAESVRSFAQRLSDAGVKPGTRRSIAGTVVRALTTTAAGAESATVAKRNRSNTANR